MSKVEITVTRNLSKPSCFEECHVNGQMILEVGSATGRGGLSILKSNFNSGDFREADIVALSIKQAGFRSKEYCGMTKIGCYGRAGS